MFSLKKFNSQKFSFKENKLLLEKKSSFKRATSLKSKNSEQNNLQDFIIKKLEKCLIIDQLNTNLPINQVTPLEKKPPNFILKTKFLKKKIIQTEKKPQCSQKKIEEKIHENKLEKEGILKRKKNKIKSKQEIFSDTPKETKEIKSSGALIIKQKGLAD